MISSNELTEDSKSKEQAPVYLIDEEAADQLIEHIYELLGTWSFCPTFHNLTTVA
jgi:hypothetical protein